MEEFQCTKCHMVFKQKKGYIRHLKEQERCPFSQVSSNHPHINFSHNVANLDLIQSTVGSHPLIELSSRLATIVPGSSPMIFPRSNHSKNSVIKMFENVGSANNYRLLLSAVNEKASVHLPKYASVPCPKCDPDLGHTLDISTLTRPLW